MYATKGISVTELICCLVRRTGFFGRYQKGLGHLQYQEYELSYELLLKIAESGHANAQYDLGVILHNGLGIDKDNEKAIYWFEKSAHQDHADAENYLGAIFKAGWGAEQDIDKALMYLKKAMEHGNEKARVSYSDLLKHGLPSEFEKE